VEKKPMGEAPKPSEYMRQLRPELYSDAASRTSHRLKPEILSHHLDTITERNQTHDFEIFCRKLCERTICPNLRPSSDGRSQSKPDHTSDQSALASSSQVPLPALTWQLLHLA
jgi:hypothetical protein